MFRTVRLSIIRSLFTVHSAMVYVIQVCRQLSSRSICSCSKAVYKPVWHTRKRKRVTSKGIAAQDACTTSYENFCLIRTCSSTVTAIVNKCHTQICIECTYMVGKNLYLYYSEHIDGKDLQVSHPRCVLCKWGWVRQNTTVVGSYLLVRRWRHVSAVLGNLQVIN